MSGSEDPVQRQGREESEQRYGVDAIRKEKRDGSLRNPERTAAELILVTGGSGSGKSAFAEETIQKSGAGSVYYIATMKVLDGEGRRKADRHRERRRTYGWTTIEQTEDLEAALPRITGRREDTAVLLEDLPNLLANEMFREGGKLVPGEDAAEKILRELALLRERCALLVIVTGDVFADGIAYDATTDAYIRSLGELGCRLGAVADTVTETVCGIPVTVRDRADRRKDRNGKGGE